MVENDVIADEEELYRSVRGQLSAEEYSYDENSGKLIIRGKAFLDRTKEPSVDRAKLRNFVPSFSQKNPTDAIVTLISKEVRSIGDVKTRKQDGNIELHTVNILYDPLYTTPQNLAHSKITADPEFFGAEKKQKDAFKLLRYSLARLATKNGWTVPPT